MGDWTTAHHATEVGTDDWRTPRSFFDRLHAEFSFRIDAAAAAHNAMLPRYWTAADNALAQDWAAECRDGGAVWCNPPYGRQIGLWIAKAAVEAGRGATVVCLTFSRTDTAWWHDWVEPHAAEVRFVRGRLRFERPDGTRGDPAPAPSVVLVFRPGPARLSWRSSMAV